MRELTTAGAVLDWWLKPQPVAEMNAVAKRLAFGMKVLHLVETAAEDLEEPHEVQCLCQDMLAEAKGLQP